MNERGCKLTSPASVSGNNPKIIAHLPYEPFKPNINIKNVSFFTVRGFKLCKTSTLDETRVRAPNPDDTTVTRLRLE